MTDFNGVRVVQNYLSRTGREEWAGLVIILTWDYSSSVDISLSIVPLNGFVSMIEATVKFIAIVIPRLSSLCLHESNVDIS